MQPGLFTPNTTSNLFVPSPVTTIKSLLESAMKRSEAINKLASSNKDELTIEIRPRKTKKVTKK